MTQVTDHLTYSEIAERYERLEDAANGRMPGSCFVCLKQRPTVLAMVLAPAEPGMQGLADRPNVIERGFSVCRPCVKRGEARRVAR